MTADVTAAAPAIIMYTYIIISVVSPVTGVFSSVESALLLLSVLTVSSIFVSLSCGVTTFTASGFVSGVISGFVSGFVSGFTSGLLSGATGLFFELSMVLLESSAPHLAQ